MKNMGISNISSLLAGLTSSNIELLFNTVLKNTKLGIDNLHNIKGHISSIIKMENARNDFDSELFLQSLWNYIGKRGISGQHMNAYDWRKFTINHDRVFLNSLKCSDERYILFIVLD